MSKQNQYKPDYTVHPGEMLAECLAFSLSQITETEPEYIEGVLSGKQPLTKEFASKLDMIFGRPDGYWYRLEKNYQSEKIRLGLENISSEDLKPEFSKTVDNHFFDLV